MAKKSARKTKLIKIAEAVVCGMKLTRDDILVVNFSAGTLQMEDASDADLIHFLMMIVGTRGALMVQAGKNSFYEYFRVLPEVLEIHTSAGSFAVWGKHLKEGFAARELSDLNNADYDAAALSLLAHSKIIGIGVPAPDPGFMRMFAALNQDPGIQDLLKSKSFKDISEYFGPEEFKVFSQDDIPYFRINTGKFNKKLLSLVAG